MSIKTALRTIAVGGSALALGAGLSLVAAGTAQAATYDLTSGTLSLTQANSSISWTTPPALGDGSWVKLPVDGSTSLYYDNLSSRTGDGAYTAIDSGSVTGLELGTTQSGGAFSTGTQFYGPYGSFQFDANLLSAAKLRFDSATTVSGYAQLVQNATYTDLTGFEIEYPAGSSNTYDVGASVTAGGIYLDALTGGYNASSDAYWLQVRTDIVSSDAFDDFEAQFHLEGDYS